MSVKPIMDGLERSDAVGEDAQAVARLGFLEWVFGYPGCITDTVVRDALDDPVVRNAASAAARAFVEVLEQAQGAGHVAPVRRGRVSRTVH